MLLCSDLVFRFRVPLFSSVGRHASPFICEGKARVTEEEKEKNEREEGFQGYRVLLLYSGPADPIDVKQGRLHVAALFVTGAMRRRHLPVMAFHSVLADVMVN